jgi:hypothetical protein
VGQIGTFVPGQNSRKPGTGQDNIFIYCPLCPSPDAAKFNLRSEGLFMNNECRERDRLMFASADYGYWEEAHEYDFKSALLDYLRHLEIKYR